MDSHQSKTSEGKPNFHLPPLSTEFFMLAAVQILLIMDHCLLLVLTSTSGCRASLDYFTTHADLVQRQRAAVEAKKVRKGLASDKDWTGEGFVKETETMVSN